MARRYTMVELPSAPPAEPAMGASGVGTQKLFPGSPIYTQKGTDIEEFTDEGIKDWYQANVLNAEIKSDTFGTFSTEFLGAPDLGAVVVGGGGDPSTPYTPNLTSPGEGSVNPKDQKEMDPASLPSATDGTYGSGGSTTNPAKTSPKIAGSTLGEYLLKPPG